MAGNMGYLRQSFSERNKERLLSRKGYSSESINDQGGSQGVGFTDGISRIWSDLRGRLQSRLIRWVNPIPEKVVFAAKVGLALALISILIYFKKPFSYVSQYSFWAVLTVVVVFEFSIVDTDLQWSPQAKRIPWYSVIYCTFSWQEYMFNRDHNVNFNDFFLQLGFAVWEPPHGRYKMFKYPWSEYVKAASELRQAFSNGNQRIGAQGAKVLLGSKVEKMMKLSLETFCMKCTRLLKSLQMLIDKKSYLLVNVGCWESGKRPKKFGGPENFQELNDNETKPLVINSLSEATINQRSFQTLKSFDPQNPSINVSVSQWDSLEDMFKQPVAWPSRLSIIGDTILNEQEVKTCESASALSLVTFTSLLIEFVARLQHLVSSFEELSKKAKFKEPVESTEIIEVHGFWARLFRRICFKD